MSIRSTYLVYSVVIAGFVSCFVTIAYIVSVNTDWYRHLFFTKIFSIPLIVFVVGTSIVFGGIFGWVVGQSMKTKLESMQTALLELENGNYQHLPSVQEDLEEMKRIWEHIKRIQERLEEQTKVSQKMATERIEWQDQLKQEVVSQERSRLARELHDSVSQQLFAASMLLSAINEQPVGTSESVQKQLTLAEKIVNNAQSEMRALLLHLRPVQLDGKSLKEGIEALLKDLSGKQPMKFIWQLEDVTLERGVEDHLFRIVQEAISNTLRHAKAQTFELILKEVNGMLLLKMMDDGVGFDMSRQKVGSYGLKSIEERVNEIGGTLKLISLPNRGTSLEIKVPIIAQRNEER
jgi:two-component system, NarL family, sensor histidine kinase LiaS